MIAWLESNQDILKDAIAWPMKVQRRLSPSSLSANLDTRKPWS